jgi:hypothetical protein
MSVSSWSYENARTCAAMIWQPSRGVQGGRENIKWSLTLLNTVLLGALVVGVLLLLSDTLDALIEVVLVWGALSGVGTFYYYQNQSLLITR